MKTLINYDYYLQGYYNAIQFGYIPDFDGVETIKAYASGFSDGKAGTKKDIEQFELS